MKKDKCILDNTQYIKVSESFFLKFVLTGRFVGVKSNLSGRKRMFWSRGKNRIYVVR